MRGLLVKLTTIIALLLLITACSTINYTRTPSLQSNQRWLIVPFVNNSATPRAGYSAAAITDSLLRYHGICNLTMYTMRTQGKGILPQEITHQQVLQIIRNARSQGYRYVVTGSVNEWRYKAGLDGEPAVGLTIQIYDAYTRHVIWSATASASGWGRDSLSDVAQNLIRRSLAAIPG